MSVRTMARVWEASKHGGTELLMLLAIADFSDDDGRAYPSIPTLAAKCRTTPRHTNRIINALKGSGELEVKLNDGPRGTNRYRVVLERLRTTPHPTPTSPLTHTSPLTPTSTTPDVGVPKPLTPMSDKPSENHQEPSKKREQRSAPRRRIPEDWQPNEKLKTWAAQVRPDLVLSRVIDNFRDYYIAKGEARVDWNASFRAWVNRERAGDTTAHSINQRAGNSAGFDQLNYHDTGGLI